MKLTAAERRRVFLAQQHAQQAMLTRVAEAPLIETAASNGGLRRVLKTAVIVMLLGGALFAARLVEFHPPASLVEALLPRL